MSHSDVLDHWNSFKPATSGHTVVQSLGLQPSGWRFVPLSQHDEGENLDFRIDEKVITGYLVGLTTDHNNQPEGLWFIGADSTKHVFYPAYGVSGSLALGKHEPNEPLCVVLSLREGIALQNAGGAVRVAYSNANLTALVTDLSKSGISCYLPLAANGEDTKYIEMVSKLAELDHVNVMNMECTIAMSQPDEIAEYIQALPKPKKPNFAYKPLFIAVGELMQQSNQIDWLIRGHIETNSLSMIFGDPASGKSFCAVDMACCIATGRDWHGQKVLAGRVLYIAGEGNRGYSNRCKAWSICNDVSLDDAPLSFSNRTVNLSDPQAASQLNAEIDSITSQTGDAVRLIVVDTVARTMDGDENSTKDMNVFVQQLDQLKAKHNCAILLVHHTGHAEKGRARGSMALKGALDAEFRVSKGQDGIIRFQCTKMKEAESAAPMAFKLKDVYLGADDDEGNPIQKAAIEYVDFTESIQPSSTGLGNNQKLAIDALNDLMDEKRDELESKGNDIENARVTVNEWRTRLLDNGLDKSRFHEIKNSLNKKCLIMIEGSYVRACSQTVF